MSRIFAILLKFAIDFKYFEYICSVLSLAFIKVWWMGYMTELQRQKIGFEYFFSLRNVETFVFNFAFFSFLYD